MKPELVEKITNLKLNQKTVVNYENLDIQVQNKNNKLISKPEKKILFTLLFDFIFLFAIFLFIKIIYFAGIITEEEVTIAYFIGGLLSSVLVWIVLPILETQFLNYKHKNTINNFNKEYSSLTFLTDLNYKPIENYNIVGVPKKPNNQSDIHHENIQQEIIKDKFSQQDKILMLREIKDLLDNGAFTQEEFDVEKNKILAN